MNSSPNTPDNQSDQPQLHPLGGEEQSFDITSNQPAMQSRQSPVQESQSATPAMSSTQKPKKSKVPLIISLIILFLLIIGGAGYTLAYFGILPLPFFNEAPEIVMKKAIEKAGDIRSSHFEENTSISIAVNPLVFSLMYGGSKTGGEEASASEIIITVHAAGDWTKTESSLSQQTQIEGSYKWEGLTAMFAGEVKTVDNKFYFKITQMPPIPFIGLALGGNDFKNQWYMVDLKEASVPLLLTMLVGFGVDPQSINQNQDAKQKITAILEKHTTAYEIQKLPSERLDNTGTYHYKLVIVPEPAQALLLDLAQLIPELLPEEVADEFDVQEVTDRIREEYDEIVPNLQALQLEVWLGKRDYLIRKFTLGYVMPKEVPEDAKQDDVNEEEEDEEESMEFLNLNYDFDDIISNIRVGVEFAQVNVNKPVSIEAPEDAKDLRKVIEETQKDMYSGGEYRFQEQNSQNSFPQAVPADSDNDGLSDAYEYVLGTDARNADTDSDGYTDSQELAGRYNPNGPGNLSEMYFSDSLYCEQDSDCVLLDSDCSDCSCPTAVNKYSWKQKECIEVPAYQCDLVCPAVEPRCSDNQCVL